MLTVRTIRADDHGAFITSLPEATLAQTPAWGAARSDDWAAESVGWFERDTLVGVALVRYRSIPLLGRSIAYISEGPLIDWSPDMLVDHLDPLIAHLHAKRAFAVRIGPPIAARRWHPDSIKQAVEDPYVSRLSGVPADVLHNDALRVRETLESHGWHQTPAGDDGVAAGAAKHQFWIPLAGRTEDDLLANMSHSWRRNLRRAANKGVRTIRETRRDLDTFHRVYSQTAARDGFTALPRTFFERLINAADAAPYCSCEMYAALHAGEPVAVALNARIGSRSEGLYAAATAEGRRRTASNAVQWHGIRHALDSGATVFSLRGVFDTVDSKDPGTGLALFKAGSGAQAVETLGEWDLPLDHRIYRAFATFAPVYQRWLDRGSGTRSDGA